MRHIRLVVKAPESWKRAYGRVGDPADGPLLSGGKGPAPTRRATVRILIVYASTKVAHALVALAFAYLLLIMMTVYAQPFPACAALFDSCECSCQVVDGDDVESASVYHPAAPSRTTLDGWKVEGSSAAHRAMVRRAFPPGLFTDS